jgi:hypothetical protein
MKYRISSMALTEMPTYKKCAYGLMCAVCPNAESGIKKLLSGVPNISVSGNQAFKTEGAKEVYAIADKGYLFTEKEIS